MPPDEIRPLEVPNDEPMDDVRPRLVGPDDRLEDWPEGGPESLPETGPDWRPLETGPLETGPLETGPWETGPDETGPLETGPDSRPWGLGVVCPDRGCEIGLAPDRPLETSPGLAPEVGLDRGPGALDTGPVCRAGGDVGICSWLNSGLSSWLISL